MTFRLSLSLATGAQVWARQEAGRTFKDQIFHVAVPLLGDKLEITVVEPTFGAAPLGSVVPALYVLDPTLMLDLVVGTKRLFDVFSGGSIPAAYVIGIGYADVDAASRRLRDCTPTQAELPVGLMHPHALGSGGASRFLEAINTEVVPYLEAHYPLDPKQRVFVGYSLSGLFGTYTLFRHPETFSRYLIISPSLWWDRGSIFGEEESLARSTVDLRAKVVFVVGDAEEQSERGWPNLGLPATVGRALRQVSNLRELSRRLASRNYSNLSLKTLLIPDGYHVTALPGEISLGIVETFAL